MVKDELVSVLEKQIKLELRSRAQGQHITKERGVGMGGAHWFFSAMLPPRMNASANDPSTEPRRPSSVAARHLMRSVDALFCSVMVKLIL